jgi:tRNA/rRNA methyltransferase
VVCCYPARVAAHAAAPAAPRAAAATDQELAGLEQALRAVLRRGGFLSGPERHAVRDLTRTLRRARLSRREAGLWRAALARLEKRLPPGG